MCPGADTESDTLSIGDPGTAPLGFGNEMSLGAAGISLGSFVNTTSINRNLKPARSQGPRRQKEGWPLSQQHLFSLSA